MNTRNFSSYSSMRLKTFSALAACCICAFNVFSQNYSSESISAGQLTILDDNYHSSAQIKVNGDVAVNGQTIYFPSHIETPCGLNEYVINLAGDGRLKIGSNTEANLNFNNDQIDGVLSQGSFTFSSKSNVRLKITTANGTLIIPDEKQTNTVFVNSVNGRTEIRTLAGLATFNEIKVGEGQYLIVGKSNAKSVILQSTLESFDFYIATAKLLILTVLGDTNQSPDNIDSSQTPVGPMK